MISNDKIFDYLKSKIPNFIKTTKSGAILFSCPNVANHRFPSKAPSATFIPESNKISCLICGFKGTMFDAIRILEPEKKNKSDAEITEYLINSMKLDMYKELDSYQTYEWSLIPILKNSKMPFEKDWVNTQHKDKVSWIKWLNNGLNLGLNCTQSKVIVIDVDFNNVESSERNELIAMLVGANTLMQDTPHGKHYIFQNDEIPQQVNIAGLKIDTRCAGGQILISPSIIDNLNYKWVNLGTEIKQMPTELKEKLLSLIKENRKIDLPSTPELQNNNEGVLNLTEGEGRNNLLTSLGGAFINKFDAENTAYILSMINRNFFKPPLPDFEIKAMLKSLTGYKLSDDESQEQAIYEYMKLVQSDVSAKDVMESLRLPRAIVDKWLSKFVKDGKAVRMARGRYQYKEKIEWSDQTPEIVEEYSYKIPLFNNIAIFQDKDVILLGARTNDGKTTIALNMLGEMAKQGTKPYYIYSEAGCFDDQTEILTNKGWKTYNTILKTDRVLSLNPIANFATYKDISNIFIYDYNGELLTYNSKALNFKLTPNHKIYYRSAYEDFYELDEMQEVNKTNKYYKFKTNFKLRDKHSRYNNIKISNKQIPKPYLLEFLGWFISEGCLIGLNTNKKIGYGIQITQRKKKYQNDIITLLNILQVNYHFYNNETFIFYDKDWWWFLRRQCYKKDLEKQRRSYIKLIPQLVKEASSEEVNYFLNSYTKGDGSFIKSGQNIRRDIFTTQKILADDLQILLLKTGKSSRITKGKTKQGFDYYIIRENFESEVDVKTKFIKKEQYNGKIWCVETKPYHLIFARRNGYCFWSGNSRFQKVSQSLGIAGKYYHTYHENPLAIELEYNAFSIIDWLHLEHKENTDTVLKHLNDELQRKGGILVIFTQLKQTYEFFAPNLIDHYPTFAARYIQDNDTKTEGHWDIQKIKEPRGNYCTYILPCIYDQNTKIFKPKDLI